MRLEEVATQGDDSGNKPIFIYNIYTYIGGAYYFNIFRA